MPAVASTTGTGEPTAGPNALRDIELRFQGDRAKIYAAWSAIANLADLAGKVSLTVRAESASGLDRMRLKNGVLEPLREAGLIDDENLPQD